MANINNLLKLLARPRAQTGINGFIPSRQYAY